MSREVNGSQLSELSSIGRGRAVSSGARVGRQPIASAILRIRCVAVFALLAGALASVPGAAQISPGPLARPHQALSGTENCTTCHVFTRGEPAFHCMSCHTEIGARVAAHKGLHASYNIKPDPSQDCVHCHSDHNGEAFPLVKWDVKTFDHKQTGYVLEGKHAGVACNKCHTPDHISPAERATIKVKDLSQTYLGVSTACATCHEDHHKGRLGPNCLQCHNYNDWKTISVGKFDHSKTRYPLTGEHAKVACAKCHTPGADKQPRYAGIPFGRCSDCHADPHHGSFAQSCQTCHNTGGWKKVSTVKVNESFDHSTTKYPLLGKHLEVACSQCHASGDFKKPLEFAKCTDCHKDEHDGQFAKRADKGECSSCHTVDGFKPSTFKLAEHEKTGYPLKGGHAKLECAQCHIPKGKNTLYKIKFQHCTDCHTDQHAGQFAGVPYLNQCEACHTVESYHPSTFGLEQHQKTRFVLNGSHVAVPCSDCHKQSAALAPKPTDQFHWQNLACTSCHEDPHKGQFDERMRQLGKNGEALGCAACHSSKSWQDLEAFDHDTTSFRLLGAHRATTCIDCHKPANLETKLSKADFSAAPSKCEQCHEDAHGKQFAKNGVTACADCHNSAKWKPSLFDHESRTSFSLRGVHQNVPCGDCHKLMRTVEDKSVLFYAPTPKQCVDCHGPATTSRE